MLLVILKGMGDLVRVLEILLSADNTLADKFRNAEVISLNYTVRLKKRDEWVIQLSCDGSIEALTDTHARLSGSARVILQEEAKELRNYLNHKIKGFHARIDGYYFLGSIEKQNNFGKLD